MPNGDDQQECCILSICCGGQHERKAKAALAAKMRTKLGDGAVDLEAVAAFVIDHYDLAPHGSLKAYRDRVAELAREYEYES